MFFVSFISNMKKFLKEFVYFFCEIVNIYLECRGVFIGYVVSCSIVYWRIGLYGSI